MSSLLLHTGSGKIEAGIDEAGRGCLAGPVFAAAVILPPDFKCDELNDSKQLNEKSREKLRELIEKEALTWSVASVSSQRIDEINILNATYEAMHLAIQSLSQTPELLVIDGNRFKNQTHIPHKTEIKGDGRFLHIAAASVLAKTHRDEWMMEAHEKYPVYHWRSNKGYGSKAHREAIRLYGPSSIHRMSFRLIDPQLAFSFD